MMPSISLSSSALKPEPLQSQIPVPHDDLRTGITVDPHVLFRLVAFVSQQVTALVSHSENQLQEAEETDEKNE
ncbi:hypothetical protein ACFX2H_001176 [Malus domestica]